MMVEVNAARLRGISWRSLIECCADTFTRHVFVSINEGADILSDDTDDGHT